MLMIKESGYVVIYGNSKLSLNCSKINFLSKAQMVTKRSLHIQEDSFSFCIKEPRLCSQQSLDIRHRGGRLLQAEGHAPKYHMLKSYVLVPQHVTIFADEAFKR